MLMQEEEEGRGGGGEATNFSFCEPTGTAQKKKKWL